jgi:hypothetical protein
VSDTAHLPWPSISCPDVSAKLTISVPLNPGVWPPWQRDHPLMSRCCCVLFLTMFAWCRRFPTYRLGGKRSHHDHKAKKAELPCRSYRPAVSVHFLAFSWARKSVDAYAISRVGAARQIACMISAARHMLACQKDWRNSNSWTKSPVTPLVTLARAGIPILRDRSSPRFRSRTTPQAVSLLSHIAWVVFFPARLMNYGNVTKFSTRPHFHYALVTEHPWTMLRRRPHKQSNRA